MWYSEEECEVWAAQQVLAEEYSIEIEEQAAKPRPKFAVGTQYSDTALSRPFVSKRTGQININRKEEAKELIALGLDKASAWVYACLLCSAGNFLMNKLNVKRIAEDSMGVSIRTARRALNKLEALMLINRPRNANGRTVITFCNRECKEHNLTVKYSL